MATPISADNTLFQVGDGATPTEAFATLAEVKSISGPTTAVAKVDTSSLSSGVWKRAKPGSIDPGDISCSLQFDPRDTGHSALMNQMKARTIKNYKIVFPVDPEWELSFTGFVTGFEITFESDQMILADVTFAIDGEWFLAEVEDED